jgi:hypothetical protein
MGFSTIQPLFATSFSSPKPSDSNPPKADQSAAVVLLQAAQKVAQSLDDAAPVESSGYSSSGSGQLIDITI